MKRVLIIVFAIFIGFSAFAQQNIKLPEKPENQSFTDYPTLKGGYWTNVQAVGGSSILFHRGNVQPIGIDWINGYRYNEWIRGGLGLGVRYIINNDKMRTDDIAWTFPIYLCAEGNIISHQDNEAVPYWAFGIGGEVRAGFYLTTTLGYRIGSPRSSFLVGLSYELHQYNTWKKNHELVGGLSLRLGYEY